MMEERKFSAYMCVWAGDKAPFVRLAMESLLNQTLLPNELMVVSDGPIPDELKAVIEDPIFAPLSVKPIYLEEHVGVGNARGVALNACENELVAIMDSDDYSMPDRFEKQIKFMSEHPEIDILGGTNGYFTEDPSEVITCCISPETQEEILKEIKTHCPFSNVTVMYRKSRVLEAGGYIDWFWEEDYYLWARMLKIGCRGHNLPDILVNVRTSPDQMGRRGGWRYFKSERKMHRYLYTAGFIGFFGYLRNISLRFVAEVLLTKRMRYIARRLFVWKKKK